MKAALGYALVGFVVIKGAGLVVPVMRWGPEMARFLTILAVLGLPVVVLLAWASTYALQHASTDGSGAELVRQSPADRWREVRGHFQEAIDLPPDARVRFLDAAADQDPALAAEIDSLLKAHGSDGPLDELAVRFGFAEDPGGA